MIAVAPHGNAFFSAEISLSLELSDHQISVSTVEPDRCVLAQPRRLDDCDAALVITVNSEPRRVPIRVIASDVPVREFAYAQR